MEENAEWRQTSMGANTHIILPNGCPSPVQRSSTESVPMQYTTEAAAA